MAERFTRFCREIYQVNECEDTEERWGRFYDEMVKVIPNPCWTCMNFGYADTRGAKELAIRDAKVIRRSV